MLAILGFGTLITFMVLVIRKWMTALVAIVVTPAFFLLFTGQGGRLPDMIATGIETVAPTAVLLLFAVLYFGIMMDAKLFDPVSRLIIRASKGDPVKICVGTAVLSCLVALDGDGTTSYMIICAAFLPLYKRLGINPLIIATIATMALGTVSGTTPWGGAATRAISVLHLNASEYFIGMIAPMVLSCLTVCVVAYVLGRVARDKMDPDHLAAVAKEIRRDHHTGDIKAWPQSRRSGSAVNGGQSGHQTSVATDIRDQNPDEGSKANWKIWVNAALTAGLLTCLVLEVADLMVLFIIGFIIALLVNFPRPSTQGEVIRQHAANAVPVVMLVLGAGVFTGILTETGMTTAMATTLIGGIPEELGGLIPVAAALIGIPLSFFMANDAYFFGIVPVLAESAAQYGIPAIDMARASVIGQMAHSIGPTSAPLWALLGIIGANLGDFQKFAWKPVLIGSLAYLGFALLTGAIALNL